MYQTVKEVLIDCTTDDYVLRLPDCQLDRKMYLDVKKALEMAGGKWKGGKTNCFMFPIDAESVKEEMTSSDKDVTKLKKEHQFFATPKEIADRMVGMLCLQGGEKILEPSAGHGALIEAVMDRAKGLQSCVYVDWCEIYPLSQKLIMSRIYPKPVCFREYNFFDLPVSEKYDCIIANPPFCNNGDIDFVMKMYDHLKVGGRLVTLTSLHYENSSNKKETAFREFLKEKGAIIERLPAKAFASSGTNIETNLIKIIRSEHE